MIQPVKCDDMQIGMCTCAGSEPRMRICIIHTGCPDSINIELNLLCSAVVVKAGGIRTKDHNLPSSFGVSAMVTTVINRR